MENRQETPNGNPEPAPVEAPVTETPAPPSENVEAIKAELAKAKDDLAKAQEQVKIHQQGASKKDREAREWQKRAQEIDDLRDTVNDLTNLIISRESGETAPEATPEKVRERITQRTQTRQQTTAAERQQSLNELAFEADNIVRNAGLDMKTSPELAKALQTFRKAAQTQDTEIAELALDMTKEVVQRMKPAAPSPAPVPAPPEKKPEAEADMAARLEREIMIKHGLLKPEGGTPSAGGQQVFLRSQLRDYHFYKANEKAILEALNKGLIKEG
jgi:hypothetical protein